VSSLAFALPLLGASLGGCFLSHEPSGEELTDAGAPPPHFDSGVARRDAGPARPDAGGADDAGLCGGPVTPGHTNRFCILEPSGAIPPGTARPLPVWHDGCFCEDALTCETSVTATTVDVTTLVCTPPAECDGCVPTIQTTCTLPPLSVGSYTIRIDGVDVADVRVARPDPGMFARPVCYDAPDPGSDAALVCRARVPLSGVSRVCRPDVSDVGSQPTIRVFEACGGCFDRSGGCEVALEPGRVVVEARRLACDCPPCGGCGTECNEIEIACHPPPLAEGDYELVVDGVSTGETLRVRDIVPGTMPPLEVCF